MKEMCLAIVFVGVATICQAEVPLMSKQQLQEGASHIVTGKVQAIYTREKVEGDWHHTAGIVEIAVNKIEKGQKVEQGDLIYARFWQERWVGKGNPPPHSSGHSLPKQNENVRVYLARKNGGYEALLPNGFEALPESADKQ